MRFDSYKELFWMVHDFFMVACFIVVAGSALVYVDWAAHWDFWR
jgi:hypothetical protein